MSRAHRSPSLVWLLAVVLSLGVLTFYRTSDAAPEKPTEPFANAVAQRAEMIALLRELNAQLKEQNALLSSGRLQVIAVPAPER